MSTLLDLPLEILIHIMMVIKDPVGLSEILRCSKLIREFLKSRPKVKGELERTILKQVLTKTSLLTNQLFSHLAQPFYYLLQSSFVLKHLKPVNLRNPIQPQIVDREMFFDINNKIHGEVTMKDGNKVKYKAKYNHGKLLYHEYYLGAEMGYPPDLDDCCHVFVGWRNGFLHGKITLTDSVSGDIIWEFYKEGKWLKTSCFSDNSSEKTDHYPWGYVTFKDNIITEQFIDGIESQELPRIVQGYCTAFTNKYKRCSRRATHNEYCYQHYIFWTLD